MKAFMAIAILWLIFCAVLSIFKSALSLRLSIRCPISGRIARLLASHPPQSPAALSLRHQIHSPLPLPSSHLGLQTQGRIRVVFSPPPSELRPTNFLLSVSTRLHRAPLILLQQLYSRSECFVQHLNSVQWRPHRVQY